MEYNAELEQAEKELQISLDEERERELARRKLVKMNRSYPDIFIRFAASVHLILGILASFWFLYLLGMKLFEAVVSIYTLLLILLFGMVSVGTAFGLQRILELSERQKNIENQKGTDNNTAN